MVSRNKRLLVILSIVPFLLLIPLIAMQFTPEVQWNSLDFTVAAALLLSAGLGIEFVIRKVAASNRRFVFLMALLASVLLLWVEMAVGLFGSPLSGA